MQSCILTDVHQRAEEGIILGYDIIAYAVWADAVVAEQPVHRGTTTLGQTTVVVVWTFRRCCGTSKDDASVVQSFKLGNEDMGNPLSVLIADVYPVYNKLDGTRILDKGAVGGFLQVFRLFVSYSLNRVELCSLLGWIPTEEHTGECTNGKAHNYAPRLDVDRPVGYKA